MSGPNKPSKRWMMILDIWNSLYIWNSVAIYHVLSKPGECTALHRHDTKDARVLPSSFAFSGKELQVHVLQWIQLQLEGCNCFHSTSLEEICLTILPNQVHTFLVCIVWFTNFPCGVVSQCYLSGKTCCFLFLEVLSMLHETSTSPSSWEGLRETDFGWLM